MRPRPAVPRRFVEEVLAGLRREYLGDAASGVLILLRAIPRDTHADMGQLQSYLALCERAWTWWSRAALEYAVVQGVGQAPRASPPPKRILCAADAAAAARRCATHKRLLDALPKDQQDLLWPWRLELARHVHVSTHHALSLAARVDGEIDLPALYPGVRWAADALVMAHSAGFIASVAGETRATLALTSEPDDPSYQMQPASGAEMPSRR